MVPDTVVCIKCQREKPSESYNRSDLRLKIRICRECKSVKRKTQGIKMLRAFRRAHAGVKIPERVAHAVAARCKGLSEISGEGGRLVCVTRRNFSGTEVGESDLVVISSKERRMWKDLSEDAQRVREQECREMQIFAEDRGDSLFGSTYNPSPSPPLSASPSACNSPCPATPISTSPLPAPSQPQPQPLPPSAFSAPTPAPSLPPAPPAVPPLPPARPKPSFWASMDSQESASAFAFLMANCGS